ncbi:hypothetical protein D3C80_1835560 [compost metagenome]
MLAGAIERVGLAEDLLAKNGNLVGADDQVSGVTGGECFGFFSCKATYQFHGGLVIAARLVYVGACRGEGQAQALQQFAPIG